MGGCVTKPRSIIITSSVLFCAGILLVLALFFAGHGIDIPLFVPLGVWFLSRFMWASYYVPAYLLFCAAYLLLKHWNRKVMLVLMTTIAPFLTLAFLLRVLLWTRGLKYFVAVLIVLALMIELYGIAILAGFRGFHIKLPAFSWRMPHIDLKALNPFKRDDDDEEDEDDEEEFDDKEFKAATAEEKAAEGDDAFAPAYLSMGFNRLSEPEEKTSFTEEEPVIEVEPELDSGLSLIHI